MHLIPFTLEDGRRVLIRADLILQVRQRDTGAELWLASYVVTVKESVEEVQALVTVR